MNPFSKLISGAFALRMMLNPRFSARFGTSLFILTARMICVGAEVDADRARNLVILDPISIQNLRIETLVADDQIFEQAIFAVGRVEPISTARAAISSGTAGRVLEVKVAPGDAVAAGAEVIRVANNEQQSDSPAVSLTAPIAGMVTAVDVRQGESFRRTKTLVEITDLREVDLVARVPEHEAAQLQPGSVARIRVPAACDKIFKAKLVRFGTEGDRKHGTVEAYYRLANRDLLMRPGMRAEFRIVAAERKVTAVPREAVQGNAVERFVFVKDYELPNAFVRVPVVIGQRNDRFIEIASGLMPGDEVVSTGAYALSSAGRGSVSLKAALDTAHGHAHTEDGVPLGDEHGHSDKHDHERDAGLPAVSQHFTPVTIFFATLSFLQFGLLYLSRRHRADTLA